jgi:hypothetical protein
MPDCQQLLRRAPLSARRIDDDPNLNVMGCTMLFVEDISVQRILYRRS